MHRRGLLSWLTWRPQLLVARDEDLGGFRAAARREGELLTDFGDVPFGFDGAPRKDIRVYPVLEWASGTRLRSASELRGFCAAQDSAVGKAVAAAGGRTAAIRSAHQPMGNSFAGLRAHTFLRGLGCESVVGMVWPHRPSHLPRAANEAVVWRWVLPLLWKQACWRKMLPGIHHCDADLGRLTL